MKRVALLTIIFGAFIYKILPNPEGGPQIDEIRTRMAASRSRPEEIKPAVSKIKSTPVVDEEKLLASSQSEIISSEAEIHEVAHFDDVPWEDMKQSWRTELKDFLFELDIDRGEEVYNAYLEESDSYEAEIDALNKEAQKADKESRQDFENLIGQLEVRHEEKLKEILGSYYSDVTDRHQQFNANIQQYARSEEEVVGVSL